MLKCNNVFNLEHSEVEHSQATTELIRTISTINIFILPVQRIMGLMCPTWHECSNSLYYFSPQIIFNFLTKAKGWHKVKYALHGRVE